jgi:hypothetical protein
MTALMATLLTSPHGSAVANERAKQEFRGLYGYRPSNGWVPNAETASAIARALGAAAYGKDSIAVREPLVAELHGDTLVVIGRVPEQLTGDPLLVRLSRIDGRVLFLEISGK